MELPLVDEIREARRLSEEAVHAANQLQLVSSVLTSLSILEQQVIPVEVALDIPGEEVVDLLADRWPQLADLHSDAPRPGSTLGEQLHARRRQMELAQRELEPLADTAHHLTQQLDHLQQEQRELLGDPRFAEAAAELHAIGVEREHYARAISPVRQRLATVGPGGTVVATLAAHIVAEAEQLRMVSDPSGMAAWRALSIAESLVGALSEAILGLGLEVRAPPGPSVPSSPEGANREGVLAELDRICAELQVLHSDLEAQRVELEAEDERLTRHLDALTQQLHVRMG